MSHRRDTLTTYELAASFDAFRPRIVDEPLVDYSGLTFGATPYCEVIPRSTEELSAVVKSARAIGIRLRLRAQGHSLNGSSLPRPGELVVRTDGLCHVRFSEAGTVTVGGGMVVWTIERLIDDWGFHLPVINDGFPGPSIGGYIAAGGFGPSSHAVGGLWENVRRIVIVDGDGEVHELTRADDVFPWMFGSMGQLGCFTEATLRLNDSDAPYPLGLSMQEPAIVRANPLAPGVSVERGLVWFTLLVPATQSVAAAEALAVLEAKFKVDAVFRPRYFYPIHSRTIVAPLVYPRAEDFVATGSWAIWRGTRAEREARISAFETAFATLAIRNRWRRYIQSEYVSSWRRYEVALGHAYRQLRALKRRFDPAGYWNPDCVFRARR